MVALDEAALTRHSTIAAAENGRGLCHSTWLLAQLRIPLTQPSDFAVVIAGQSAATSSLLRPCTRWVLLLMG